MDKDTSIASSTEEKPVKQALIKGTFLASVAGMSMLFGFGSMIAMTKKKDPKMFTEGLLSTTVEEGGASMAMRALGRATLYTVSVFAIFTFGIWKLSGAHNMQEFTASIKSKMPDVPKNKPQGRSEFKNLRELVAYITEEKPKTD